MSKCNNDSGDYVAWVIFPYSLSQRLQLGGGGGAGARAVVVETLAQSSDQASQVTHSDEMAETGSITFFGVLFICFAISTSSSRRVFSDIPDEKWDYVKVRENAHMFWWLYGADTNEPSERIHKPLIMWLQGGPGGSSTGYGNFEELGPLTVDLKPRNTTWTKAANVLFVDNPVGAGFSYVTDKSAYTTNVTGKLSGLCFGFISVFFLFS